MDEKFDRFCEDVNHRLCQLELKVSEQTYVSNSSPLGPKSDRFPDSHVEPVATGHAQTCASGSVHDTQGDFQALKDSLARIKLPPELRLNESRQGIKKADQPVLNVLTRCSRYNETAVRLLSTIEAGQSITQDTLDQFMVIFNAQCKYLQDEFAAILVNGQFDSSTSRLFRALQRNTSGLNPESLDSLRTAATLSAAGRPARGSGSIQQFRGRGRGSYGRQDVFQGFAQRQFPNKRFNKDNYHATEDKDE